MSEPIERIQALMGALPGKDISLGHQFLHERDFDSLKELINSAIYKVRRNLKKEEPREEHSNVSLEDLSRLKSEVDTYMIREEIFENDMLNGFDDCEIEKEFY